MSTHQATSEGSIASGTYDSYARYQCIDEYPNQPEIIEYPMTEIEQAEMNALEAAARTETDDKGEQAASWGYEAMYESPAGWDGGTPYSAETAPSAAVGLLQFIAHALGFRLTPID